MSSDVQSFYDEFRDRRMVAYRIDGSPRINAAFAFARRHLRDRKVIADVGCGIGMFAELVGKEFPHARIIAVDLSEKNIEYARSTVNASNVMLKVASVTDQFVVLREMAGGSIDAFCLIDVIEHIQVEARAKMLVRMAESSSESAVLILAYPSAEYQRYLMGHDPSELQIIDNVVEIATLIQEAEQAGWYLKEFRYVDLWMTNQYIHAAFEKRLEVERRQTSVSFVNKLKFHFDRVFLKRRRVGRYGRVLDTNATGL